MITAAGLIMAASMYGLVFASAGGVVQNFRPRVELLLDTFLVRTVTDTPLPCWLGRRTSGCRQAAAGNLVAMADAVCTTGQT